MFVMEKYSNLKLRQTWSQIRQNPVTDLAAVCKNSATYLVFPSKLLNFNKLATTSVTSF